MSARSTHLKLAGAAGAAALAVGLVSAPSLAVGPVTATATYTCLGGLTTADVSFSFTPPTSTALVAGQKEQIPGTASVTLPPGATHLLLTTEGWDSFTGTVTAPTPSTTLGMNLSIPLTPVGTPPGTDGTNTTATGTGNAILDYPAAGTYTLQTGDLTATLQGFKSGSKVGSPVPVGCVAPTDGSTQLKDSLSNTTSITVTKDASKTATTAKYVAKKHSAIGTAKVKGAKYGLAGTGKVKFTLKLGKHTIKTLSGKLNKKGIASVTFKNVTKKGKYSITAKFGGDGGLKSSSGKATFKV